MILNLAVGHIFRKMQAELIKSFFFLVQKVKKIIEPNSIEKVKIYKSDRYDYNGY